MIDLEDTYKLDNFANEGKGYLDMKWNHFTGNAIIVIISSSFTKQGSFKYNSNGNPHIFNYSY